MIKKPVVAGSFYPNDKNILSSMLTQFFFNAEMHSKEKQGKRLIALIAPHAGYVYSGQTAANIYNIAKQYHYKRAIVIAPSHHTNTQDFFVGNYEAYQTPLGNMKTDLLAIKELLVLSEFVFNEYVDAREHALEVQLPFLHFINPEIRIVPIIFCKQTFQNTEILAKHLLELHDDKTLIVISTDLSHYHTAKQAEAMDSLLIENVKNHDIAGLQNNLINHKVEACGYGGILALMNMSKALGNVEVDNVFYSQSGQVSGDNNQVVGYLSCGYYV
jgi:AmmeMemoRadiSam system protein B